MSFFASIAEIALLLAQARIELKADRWLFKVDCCAIPKHLQVFAKIQEDCRARFVQKR